MARFRVSKRLSHLLAVLIISKKLIQYICKTHASFRLYYTFPNQLFLYNRKLNEFENFTEY